VSPSTWTRIDLASESASWKGAGWRLVEAQHKVATIRLTGGDPTAQSVLEGMLEEFKPQLPPEAQGLHWLLATPLRYFPPPGGSRFRRREDPGVFYGAEDRKSACAEAGYWRLRFWLDSDALREQIRSIPVTLFRFEAAAARAIDLTMPPLLEHRPLWTHPVDYTHTQALAERARTAGIGAIRYESVRRPGGRCLAFLTPDVFRHVKGAFRNVQQTWTLHLAPPNRLVCQRDLGRDSWAFEFEVGD
jgi:hypothetical protein